MADKAGLYEVLWRPEEVGITHAHQLLVPLSQGLQRLLAAPDDYRIFNPENGWGNYEQLVSFVQQYLIACVNNPNATVEADR